MPTMIKYSLFLCFIWFFIFLSWYLRYHKNYGKKNSKEKNTNVVKKNNAFLFLHIFSFFFDGGLIFYVQNLESKKRGHDTMIAKNKKTMGMSYPFHFFKKKAPLFVFSKSRVYGRGPFSSTFRFSENRALCPLPDGRKFY